MLQCIRKKLWTREHAGNVWGRTCTPTAAVPEAATRGPRGRCSRRRLRKCSTVFTNLNKDSQRWRRLACSSKIYQCERTGRQ